MSTVINMNNHAVSIKLVKLAADGTVLETDHITVMPKRKVELPPGFKVNTNWASKNPKVLIDSKESA